MSQNNNTQEYSFYDSRCKNEIVEAPSSSFSNFQKAYKVFVQSYKNQTKVPCASTATRIINQTKDTHSFVNDIPSTRNQFAIRKNDESFNVRQNTEINEKENTNNSGDLTFHAASKKCTTCFQVFDCQNELEKHITNAHNFETCLKEKQRSMHTAKLRKLEPAKKLTVDSIDCKLCDKKFRSQKAYRVHARTHMGEKSYTCHICGKQFRQTGSLYYHLKHVHAGIKNHSCEICGRCFAMKSAMLDHRRIHTNERPYVCDSCGKTFRTKASLYIHNKSHTNEYPYKCAHCPKAFRWKQQMLGHLTIHTGEKNHTCDVCGKGFGVRNALTRHKLTHSEEKPYSCEHCGISFGQKRYLKNHERARHK